MNKKILYICPNGYLGGAEKFVYTAIKAHLELGNQVEVLFFNDGELVKKFQEESLPYKVLSSKFKLSQIGALIKALKEIRTYISNKGFDLIHATMPYAHIVTSLALLGCNVKRVWFQHGPVGGVLDKLANLFSVDKILFNSSYLQMIHNQMLFAFRFKDRQRIIKLGIEKNATSDKRIKDIRESYLSDSHQQLWILPGRITNWKGQHLLIKAIAQLVKAGKFKKEAKVLIIGEAKRDSDKIYEQELRELIKDSELEGVIELIGHQPDIYNFFGASDVTFHCSTVPEPFGLVAAEAMLSKSFVIGSSAGGISDILKNKETGLSYDSLGDKAVENLVEVISYYLKDDFDSNSCKENAYNLIAKDYSVEQMIADLNDSYETLF